MIKIKEIGSNCSYVNVGFNLSDLKTIKNYLQLVNIDPWKHYKYGGVSFIEYNWDKLFYDYTSNETTHICGWDKDCIKHIDIINQLLKE